MLLVRTVVSGFLFLSRLVQAYAISRARGHQINTSELLDSYDYVVVGGGTSGLVVANRLSENPKVTILVIEAGQLDRKEDFIEIPGLAGGAVGTSYDWNLTYAANSDIGGRQVAVAQGKVVGGSSLLNRMLFHRGSAYDYDAWEVLGNVGWNWNSMLKYFKKSEIFSSPNTNLTAQFGVTFDPSSHGSAGRVHASYSPWYWPSVSNFATAAKELGIPQPRDGMEGKPGSLFVTHAQDPKTVTRSSARKAYYDTAVDRDNLHLLTGNKVTKLVTLSNGSISVTGVEFAEAGGAPRRTVGVKKEAIVAAGTLHTPQILQLSGIGEASLLSRFNITPLVDLPVGYNLHDHIYAPAVFNASFPIRNSMLQSNATFAQAARAEYDSQKTGPYSTATGDLLWFLPTSTYTNKTAALHAAAIAQDPSAFLGGVPSSVSTGYAAIHSVLSDTLASPNAATLEFLPADGTILVAAQHPFSRGSVKIQSSDPFAAPIADVAFLRNPLDVQLIVEGIKFARRIMATQALRDVSPLEVAPGANVTSDAALGQYVRSQATTLWHPVGTCHFGKREEGACVDAELKVFGVSNLRVVDASVVPIAPAAHIMQTVYGVAEKAADIIKKSW